MSIKLDFVLHKSEAICFLYMKWWWIDEEGGGRWMREGVRRAAVYFQGVIV